MKAFFKSKFFKTISTIICVMIALTLILSLVGNTIAPQSAIIGTIISPIEYVTGYVSHTFSNFFTSVERAEILENENNILREEMRNLREKLVDYDKYKSENEFYSEFLEIKKEHPDYQFQPAMVVSYDSLDVYKSFTINCGTAQGISQFDPVITADGLVGYVSEVGLTHATVMTLLNPNLSVSATDNRTRETGVVSGDAKLVASGCCKMSYLSRSSAMNLGDYVITSGAGGVFPAGLMVGTVTEIGQESADVSLYAVLRPFVEPTGLSDVMVITSFEGQGKIK
ncbi:MAG: rod shape-determining protein MreC [Clostridia bacterium]|nr:rod shape-determining protein MreC [Clostridia bacterium]